ncbi:hypothetical protein GGI07_001129 [Coemansia sp. Benny D115]|nr:hypothetical protein GGI07_001129 [Coemansia sp. Benny D115]
MRYTSPRIQLTLVATVLVLTTVFRRLVDTYLLHATIVDENLSYDRNLSTGIVGCLSGVVGIFLVNLAGIRSMFVLYTLTNILYAISIVVQYHGGGSTFHQVAQVLNAAGYDLGRVATLVIVLAYMREIWKARAVAIFLILEYSSITIGNLIAIHSNDSDSKRSYSKQLVLIFKNKYMLLLIPYMFAYPFAFGTANVTLKITQTIVLFDVGKILVILMGQLLDVQWTGRRKRSLVALALLVIIFIVSGALTVYVRAYKYVFSSIYQSWSPAELEQYMPVSDSGRAWSQQTAYNPVLIV